MTPISTLVLTLIALHVIEGLFWIKRSAVPFAQRWRGFGVVSTENPFGDGTHCFLLASPLPPLFPLYVVEPWPLVITRDQAWLIDGDTKLAITPEQAAEAQAETKEVLGPGFRFKTSSPTGARLVAKALLTFGKSSPEEREAQAEAALKARTDRTAIAARKLELEAQTRVLGALGNLFPWVMFGVVLGVFYVPFLGPRWPALVATLALVLVLIWIEMFRAHRALYPKLRWDRAMKMLLLCLSFPAAARARAWLGRDALAAFDPLAVASVLLEKPALEAFAAPLWRRLEHPLTTELEPAAERERLRKAYRRLLGEFGIKTTDLLAPPTPSGPEAKSYCPRCRAEYAEPSGACPECPGVERVRF
ncbi:MAG: hypothetical protein U1E65_32015 [Myxococcota bacterium]